MTSGSFVNIQSLDRNELSFEATNDVSISQSFEETQPFEITKMTNVEPTADGTVTHTRFQRMSITLHKVLNGNFHSQPISEAQFWP